MSSIFHGGNTYIYYNTDANNNIPTAIGYQNIDYLGAFPQVKINSSTTQLETYNDEWVQVLSGSMSIDSVSIVVHYVADNSSHVFLDNAFTNQTNFQIKVSLYESQDSLEQHYVILSGYISAWSDSGDQNEVYDRTYTFTAEDIISRGTATDPALLKQGDFGIGADGEAIPQYESSTPSGNSFIKVPALRSDNPLGIDLGGFAYVDNGGDQTAQFIISETGPLNLYIKNTDNAWTQLKTTAQNDQTYVPLTRTVNGKALSSNITLSSSDTGSLALTGGTLTGALTGTSATFTGAVSTGSLSSTNLSLTTPLSVLNGGTGGSDIATARTNLSVYSKDEIDSTVSTLVPKTTTINSKDLSTNIVLDSTDIGSLAISNNLSDVDDTDTARTNILAAKSGENNDITSITGLTTALSIAQGGTGNSTGLAVSATKLATARTFIVDLNSTASVSFDGTANVVPGITGTLPIVNGGTGSTTATAALTNLGAVAKAGDTMSGALLVSDGTNSSRIGFGGIDLSNATPFIDFHFGNSTTDYTTRLVEDYSGHLAIKQSETTYGGLSASNYRSIGGTLGASDSSNTNIFDFIVSGGNLQLNRSGTGYINWNGTAMNTAGAIAFSSTANARTSLLNMGVSGAFNRILIPISTTQAMLIQSGTSVITLNSSGETTFSWPTAYATTSSFVGVDGDGNVVGSNVTSGLVFWNMTSSGINVRNRFWSASGLGYTQGSFRLNWFVMGIVNL